MTAEQNKLLVRRLAGQAVNPDNLECYIFRVSGGEAGGRVRVGDNLARMASSA